MTIACYVPYLLPRLTAARIVGEHVQAAIALGTRTPRILWRHVLPLISAPLIVEGTFAVAGVIIAEAGLSFLGLGVQEPMTSWGALVNEGSQEMESAPWTLIFPAIFLAVTLFCFNFIGDGLRDALDPRDRGE